MFSFAEVPECQMLISSMPDVLEQLICISLSEQFSCDVAAVVVETFLLLAHNADAHLYLSKPDIIEGLLQVYTVRTGVDVASLSEDEKLNMIDLRLVYLQIIFDI